MFAAIFELAKTTTLTMMISANAKAGTLTMCVKPTPRKGEEAAVTKELTLTATPEDFEQNFPACLTSYTDTHQSLLEQTAVTTAVLEAAKQAQVAKGTKAATAAAHGSLPKPTATHATDRAALKPADESTSGDNDPDTNGDGKKDPFA